MRSIPWILPLEDSDGNLSRPPVDIFERWDDKLFSLRSWVAGILWNVVITHLSTLFGVLLFN
jgi:hypothetical protein